MPDVWLIGTPDESLDGANVGVSLPDGSVLWRARLDRRPAKRLPFDDIYARVSDSPPPARRAAKKVLADMGITAAWEIEGVTPDGEVVPARDLDSDPGDLIWAEWVDALLAHTPLTAAHLDREVAIERMKRGEAHAEVAAEKRTIADIRSNRRAGLVKRPPHPDRKVAEAP